MNDAAYSLARTGETGELMLIDALVARKINLLMGGAVLAPWEVGELPEETVDAIFSLGQVGDYRQGLNQVEGIFAKWRSEHARK